MLDTVARKLVAHRKLVLGLVIALTVLMAGFTVTVRFDSSIEIWFLASDEELVRYNAFIDRFGADEIAVIGVFADDVFAPPVMAAIDRISQAAKDAPHAHRVRSLTTTRDFVESPDGIDVPALVPQLPTSAAQSAAIRARAMDSKLIEGLLVSGDGRAAAVVVELAHDGNTFEGKTALVRRLREIAEAEATDGIETRLSGTPVFDETLFRYNERDINLTSPGLILLVILGCWLIFRQVAAALLPLGVVIVSVVWTFGLMGLCQADLTILSSALISLIMAVGVADSIHILSAFQKLRADGVDREEALVQSISKMAVPCFFTSATTAAGLLSLLISQLAPVREFGVFAAFGVMMAFVFSMLLVPTVVGLVRPVAPAVLERRRTGRFSRLLARLGSVSPGASRVIVVASLCVVGLSVWSATQLKVGVNPIEWFRVDDPARVDIEAIDQALGGSTSLEFLVRAPNQGLQTPENQQRLYDFERWLESRAAVTRALSSADVLERVHALLKPPDDTSTLPDAADKVATSFLFVEDTEDFHAIVKEDYSVGRMTARIRLSEASEIVDDLPAIEARLAEVFTDDALSVEMTGYAKLMGKMQQYLLDSQIRSLLIAFAVITLLMIALLGSWRLGLFAMIPNLAPVAVGLGVMHWLGIGLDPGSVMIGCIALGLVVDDTVHTLIALRRGLAAGLDLDAAVSAAIADAGHAVVLTSAILAGGFAFMLMGSFTPNMNFGGVSALIIVTALLADLVLLPAALRVLKPAV